MQDLTADLQTDEIYEGNVPRVRGFRKSKDELGRTRQIVRGNDSRSENQRDDRAAKRKDPREA